MLQGADWGCASFLLADIGIEADARAVITLAEKTFGGVDVNVNNVSAPSDPGEPHHKSPATTKGDDMSVQASGTFEVKLTPQTPDDKSAPIGRFSINKQFHGDLDGASQGEMLAVSTETQGSAGYVAMEQVTGTLNGRSGTFALQHNGVMTRGTPQLSVTVVPDSGTGQLVGLAGRMDIQIADGKHSYQFVYTLPQTP